MPTGVLLEDDNITGAEVKTGKTSFSLSQVFEGNSQSLKQKGAIFGLPLKDFFIKSVTLPPLSKKELPGAIDLQIASNLPYDQSGAFVSYQLKKLLKGYQLFILATPKKDIFKPKAIIPEQIALYALAANHNLLQPEKKLLIVYITRDEVMTLTVDGFDIVFMRSFKMAGNIINSLKLSAQAVYLRDERTMLDIDELVLFVDDAAYDEALIEDIKRAFTVETQLIRSSTIFPGEKLSNDKVLIASGLALSKPLLKKLNGWNVFQSDLNYSKSIKRGLLYTLPLWPLFFTLYLQAEVQSKQSGIKGLQGRIAALKPKYRLVKEIADEVTKMEDFLKTSGSALVSPESWHKTIKFLEEARPFGLWFTTISGKTYGTVMVNGKAEDDSLITLFIKKLIDSKLLSEVNLSFTSTTEKGVDFQITMKMKEKQW